MTANRSCPGTSEQAPLESSTGSIGSTAPGTYTLVPRRYASRSTGERGLTYALTSAICTHTRQPPPSSVRAEMASSKSRALAGSIVNVGSDRRSRRAPAASTGASEADRAARADRGIESRATDRDRPSAPRSRLGPRRAGPSRLTTRARPPRPFPPRLGVPGRTTTRSPTSYRLSRLTTIRGPGEKNGSATWNLPRRSITATRAPPSSKPGAAAPPRRAGPGLT